MMRPASYRVRDATLYVCTHAGGVLRLGGPLSGPLTGETHAPFQWGAGVAVSPWQLDFARRRLAAGDGEDGPLGPLKWRLFRLGREELFYRGVKR